MTTANNQHDICCPPLDPTQWDDKRFVWENKAFIKEKVCTFLYMPLNFGSVMKKATAKIEKSGAQFLEGMLLSENTSKWNMDLYLAVDKPVPHTDQTTMSGSFYSKVYEGPFQHAGKWCKDFEKTVSDMGLTSQKVFLWYTTCPKCAKKYGKNYVVIVGLLQ
jgi:hypothetical protein